MDSVKRTLLDHVLGVNRLPRCGYAAPRVMKAWNVLRIGCICLVLGSLAGTPTLAAEPLPITSVSPANGETQPLFGDFQFELVSPLMHLGNVYVTVASQDALGPDGALVSTSSLDYFGLRESSASPGTFVGTSGLPVNGWGYTAGTYHWQISAVYTEVLGGSLRAHQELSPVFTLVLAPLASSLPSSENTRPPGKTPSGPPPATLTLAQSHMAIKAFISKETRQRAHHLVDKCLKRSPSAVVCKATWFSAWPPALNSTRTTGTFILQGQPGGIHLAFAGVREPWHCVRSAVKRCGSRLYWLASLP